MSTSADFTQLSISQNEHRWSAMLLDFETVEILRSEQTIEPGPVVAEFNFGEVSIAISAKVSVAQPSSIGQRLSIKPEDSGLWGYCLTATKSNTLEMPALIGHTRPGIGPAPSAFVLKPQVLKRHWPKLSAVVLAIIVSALTYGRFFHSVSTNASVATDEVIVTASGAGRVIFTKNENRVAAGEPVVGIARSRSRDRAMESPCDCIVSRRLVSKGSWVAKADPLVALSQVDGRRYIRAVFPATDIPQLLRGELLTFKFQDGSVTRTPVPTKEILEASKSIVPGLVEVNLDPGRELPIALVGEQVEISYSVVPRPLAFLMSVFGESQ